MEKNNVKIDAELDFVSPKFNPLAVLNAEDLEPPCPEICGFNSLREYEMVVREKRHLPSSDKIYPAEEQDAGTLKAKSPPSLQIDFLEVPRHGPLGILQQWYRGNVLVRVWIRHSAGVRGVCTGTLIAFDKHWNIVLRDIEETFVPFDERNLKRIKKKKKRKSRFAGQLAPPDCSELTSHNQKPSDENSQSEDKTKCTILATEDRTECTISEDRKECTILATPPEGSGYKLSYCTELYRKSPSVRVRTVDQLFIRGDNIVLIAKIPHNT